MALGFVPGALAAQAIEREVAGVEDGTVRLAFATRPGVEICDQGIRIGENRVWWRSHRPGDARSNCRLDFAEVELAVRDGRVRDVDVVRPSDSAPDRLLDLGEVAASDAAAYFLSLAEGGADARVGADALLPALVADVEGLWRDVLALARNRSLPSRVRQSALFWVGQEAAAAVTEELSAVAAADDEEEDVRNAAVFALSQRPHEEGIPILMDLARSAPHPETRRTAMFWLAQSHDDRVIGFFEEILLGQGVG
jgi:hypothetical protein